MLEELGADGGRDRRRARRREHQPRLRRAAPAAAARRACAPSGAHLGVALDGDADRVILVDEHGDVVDGDEVLAMLGIELHRQRPAGRTPAWSRR